MAVALMRILLPETHLGSEDGCMAFDAGLADRIRLVMPRNRAITERKMFGGLAFLLHGHMFCGVVKSDLMLRLGEEAAATALLQPHTRPMDFTGKALRSIYVDAHGLDSDEALRTWVECALKYVDKLPPKE
jgi:TfoX/Sxy family transcriptional regulator of competence genes